jgi:phenylalanyl-tRNA synthetase beta chain
MKISLNWLNDFVDLSGIGIKEIVSRFSLITAEIEGYEVKGEGITGVVVGEIKTCQLHPKSSKPLWVLTVDRGDKVVQVVCGAPNCRVGLKTAFAKVGARLGDLEIKVANLAGVESNGMCCGGDELGISCDHSGIVELDGALVNGTPIEEVLPIRDILIEIDNKSLTNRPDLWGHYGIAREMSVIFNRKLKPPATMQTEKYKDLPKIPVTIENKKDCLSYGAIRVNNITRKTSQLPMQIRLYYCGINPHGFLVDLTNYIMLELGQPCHAFDARKIGKISVGNESGGKFVTLKDQEVNVTPEMLFIKSDGKPVALAGVIGGKNSEIESDTTDCVFEFATFDAACVRKTAAAIGTRTDASNRFEKSLDVNLNKIAAERTLKWLVDKNVKSIHVASCFNHVIAVPQKEINLSVRKDYLERFCGVDFNYKTVERNLAALGFNPVTADDEIRVTVPSWRATKDISCTADLIEEIVRTYGYDNIKPVAPKIAVKPVESMPLVRLSMHLKELLCDKYAFDEVHTYIWNDSKLNSRLNIETPSHLRIVNSCIKDDDAIRSAMIPSLICVAARNRKLGEMNIFEIGRVVSGIGKDGKAVESQVLGLCIASKTESGDVLYKKMSEIMRDIFGLCGFEIKYKIGGMKQDNYLHPKNNASIYIGDKLVGGIGIVHPSTAAAIDPKMNLAAAAIHLDWLDGLQVKMAESVKVSKYQKTVLDFTFTTKEVYGEVEVLFNIFKHPLVIDFRLKDIYQESDGRKSYTLAFTVGSYERTLTAADLEDVHKKIIEYGRKNGLVIKE